MLTQEQRTRVWEEWLAAEMRAAYFGDLASTYYSRQRIATWVTLFFSSGAVVAFLTRVPPGSWWDDISPWALAILPLVAAGASLYALVAQNIKAGLDSADLHLRWNKLANEYERIFQSQQVSDVEGLLAKLADTRAEVSKSGTAFPNDEKRMAKWFDLVVAQHHVAT